MCDYLARQEFCRSPGPNPQSIVSPHRQVSQECSDADAVADALEEFRSNSVVRVPAIRRGNYPGKKAQTRPTVASMRRLRPRSFPILYLPC